MTTKELINQYVTAHADNRWMDASELEALLTEFAEKLKAKQVAVIKCEKKSPITGGEMQLMQERTSVKFRGEEVSFVKKYYHCVDSGQEFTDTELDNDNMWAIFRAYWERKGFEHFYDIDGYREEQKSASEDLEKKELANSAKSSKNLDREIGMFTTKQLLKKRERSTGIYHLTQKDCDNIARYFAGWQKEQMMKDAVDAQIVGVNPKFNSYMANFFSITPFELMQKVKVIIVKE